MRDDHFVGVTALDLFDRSVLFTVLLGLVMLLPVLVQSMVTFDPRSFSPLRWWIAGLELFDEPPTSLVTM